MFFKLSNDKYPSSFQLKIINYPKIIEIVETINVILKLNHFIKSLSFDIENIILLLAKNTIRIEELKLIYFTLYFTIFYMCL